MRLETLTSNKKGTDLKMATVIMEIEVPLIKQEDVNQTYNGEADICACGCSGDYAEANTAASIRRVGLINNNMHKVKLFEGMNEDIYELLSDSGNRVTRIYTKTRALRSMETKS
jgi:hypothetical protein